MSKRILIIEDERAIAELEKDYLELAGYETHIVDNGEAGLYEAVNGSYDMLIIDIMLPGRSGYEILKSVSEEKDIPVILVSAKKSDIDKVKGFGLGADDYITKPFSPSELTARVRAHLMRYDRLKGISASDYEDRLAARGLRIDRQLKKVFLNGIDRDFTQKEFELLSFLAEHPDQTFSKKELFEKVWGMDSLGDAATVTVHVKRIREKIEKNTSDPDFVETVWGKGYRFRS